MNEPEDAKASPSPFPDESVDSESSRIGAATEINGGDIVDVKPQIKNELPADQVNTWSTRPRRKVAIPMYYPEHISTPSPETVIKKEDTQLRGSTKVPLIKSNKVKLKGRASDSCITVTLPETKGIKRKLDTSLPLVKKVQINTVNIPVANVSKPKPKKLMASTSAPRLQNFIEYSAEKKARIKPRINYSEALVDEALMYEEILLNKRQKEQQIALEKCRIKEPKQNLMDRFVTKTKISTAGTHVPRKMTGPKPAIVIPKATPKAEPIPVVGSEITLLPIAKTENRASNKTNAGMNITLDKIKQTLSTNPAKVFNINSSVSIQLKPPALQRVASTSPGLTIKNIHSLFDSSKDGLQKTVKCRYCTESFGNVKLLAMHQLIHMKVATHKVGQVQILESRHRKVRHNSARNLLILLIFRNILSKYFILFFRVAWSIWVMKK